MQKICDFFLSIPNLDLFSHESNAYKYKNLTIFLFKKVADSIDHVFVHDKPISKPGVILCIKPLVVIVVRLCK